MWAESGIKHALVNKFKSGLEPLTLARLTIWKTVYGAESKQLNIGPCGSSCPSQAREGKNKHIMICLLALTLSWCRWPKTLSWIRV